MSPSIVCFYSWEMPDVIVEFPISQDRQRLEELVAEYRNKLDAVSKSTITGFIEFLNDKGITASIQKPDHNIRFI